MAYICAANIAAARVTDVALTRTGLESWQAFLAAEGQLCADSSRLCVVTARETVRGRLQACTYNPFVSPRAAAGLCATRLQSHVHRSAQ